ncbi:MAG: HNH endonuclease [Candidatus Methanofastidiosa archaeon]|nr:HNH endonuclease [Candidatus Methanofastidiosa archaeon]
MAINEWTEWKQKKEKESKITFWVSRFQQAKTQLEWKKVYESYIRSEIWREIRNQAIIRANNECEKCGSHLEKLDVHHINYDNIVGKEKTEDLQVLCYPCHQKADRIRNIKTDERRKNSRYRVRFESFAIKKYGDDWNLDYDEETIEIEFITFLFKQYCKDNYFEYDPNLDPDSDIEFLEFWNDVLDGSQ